MDTLLWSDSILVLWDSYMNVHTCTLRLVLFSGCGVNRSRCVVSGLVWVWVLRPWYQPPWCFVTWPPPWVLTAGPLNTSGYSLSLLCRRDVFCFQTIQVQFIYLFTFIVMFVSWCEGTLESLILRIITKTSGREKTGWQISVLLQHLSLT